MGLSGSNINSTKNTKQQNRIALVELVAEINCGICFSCLPAWQVMLTPALSLMHVISGHLLMEKTESLLDAQLGAIR